MLKRNKTIQIFMHLKNFTLSRHTFSLKFVWNNTWNGDVSSFALLKNLNIHVNCLPYISGFTISLQLFKTSEYCRT